MTAWSKRRDECTRQLSLGHYEILELPRFSSHESVKRSYRDLARQWHPDKHQHKSQDLQERAARHFSRIQEAYEVLSSDPSKRSYDSSLLRREVRATSTESDAPKLRFRASTLKSGSIPSAEGNAPTCTSD